MVCKFQSNYYDEDIEYNTIQNLINLRNQFIQGQITKDMYYTERKRIVDAYKQTKA